jgi:hypothetical protein
MAGDDDGDDRHGAGAGRVPTVLSMMTRLLLLIAIALLTACGGGTPPPVAIVNHAVAAPVSNPLPLNTTGMEIRKVATVQDGTNGGLSITRDTTQLFGGSPTWVNVAAFFHSIAGKLNTSIEWAVLSIMDDRADRGQSVAVYAQTNKWSDGQSFAAVSEIADVEGHKGAAVAHEFDVWTTGLDSGGRHGLYVVSGDAREIRGLGRSAVAEATSAIIIGQTMSTPWASWKNGIEFTGNYRESVIKLVSPTTGQVMFEIKPNGDIYRRGVLLP